jgi:alkanesulfonate monooxygenase SsuD/methylene tetrahydromethanopterin reductase-like flavin-dependent oxidoreductase (luciferase family)
MKKIGFLSFGHWSATSHSQTRSAADVLLQSIELAAAAEELGADGAYFRVHHFARQLSSPFPLLAAVGARTKRIEIGTAVIDMRYENPFYMVEDAGSADLIAGGRLQLGISRGSPEQVIEGWRHFGYAPAKGETDADMGRRNGEIFFELLKGKGFAEPNPRPMFPNPPGLLRLEPLSEGLRDRIWWGSASNATAIWAAQRGMNLQSSTLKADESGEPFHVQQARQIRAFRQAWTEAGHKREPRVSVSRSIFALMDDRDGAYFGRDGSNDQVGLIDNIRAVFGRSYAAEPGKLIEELRKDEAIAEADTLLFDRAESARRRIQLACNRGHPDARRARSGLAMNAMNERIVTRLPALRRELLASKSWPVQLTRVWSEIQLTSHFLPPSSEYDCSKCGDLDISAVQSNLTRTLFSSRKSCA